MDWQVILLIVLTVLLLFVWLPLLFFSVRKVIREDKARRKGDQERNNNQK